jgi:hypothetical protein
MGGQRMLRKMGIYLFLFIFILPIVKPDHNAMAGYCPSSKNGKCPGQKKIIHKRSDFTAERRAKMMEEARKICQKKYGAPSRVYKLDYYKWTVICAEPGY